MDVLKSLSKPSNSPGKPNAGRRSFLWKVGAAISATLASAVPSMSNHSNQGAGLDAEVDRLSNQLGILEDENAIRGLQQTYENLLHNGKYEEVMDLFIDDGEVIFNGGVFKGKSGGVRRLYCERFKSGLTGRKIEPAPGFQINAEQQQDIVEVATDRRSAKTRFAYSMQVGTPIVPDSQLVRMARLHGEGIMKWWEGGTYELSYVKDMKDGVWKIKRLEYRVLSKAYYRPGISHAGPISVPPFSKAYPEDPAGPDKLISQAQELRKA
jgi:hypothetical protein